MNRQPAGWRVIAVVDGALKVISVDFTVKSAAESYRELALKTHPSAYVAAVPEQRVPRDKRNRPSW
jgi:hypothetical protein